MAVIFVGSSLEGRLYAEEVARLVRSEGSEALLWWSDRAFPPSSTLFESLSRILDTVDGAILIATPDDRRMRRGIDISLSPTQNLMLEFGLFNGRLGPQCVAIMLVERTQLPSDLAGVKTMQVRSRAHYADDADFVANEIAHHLRHWVQGLDVASKDGSRISNLIRRIAPNTSDRDRMTFKAELLAKQIDLSAFARQPSDVIRETISRYIRVLPGSQTVGFNVKTNVHSYINFSEVPEGSEDERILVDYFSRFLAERCRAEPQLPTLLAISKMAETRILRLAALRLPYPVVSVNPAGPTRDRQIEGYTEVNDRAILVHDVPLAGYHLIECISTLRRARIRADSIVALVRHDGDPSRLNALLGENRVTMHAAATFDSLKLTADLSPLSSRPATCLICLILTDSDQVPFRDLFTRSQSPSEILEQSSNFAVFADVAPLTPGHVLIVPKHHVNCLADLTNDERRELEGLRVRVTRSISTGAQSPVVGFEHGLCEPAEPDSCSIDHAHLHVLPLDDSQLLARLQADYRCEQIDSPYDLKRSWTGDSEYLLLIDNAGVGHFAQPERPVSQYFRRLVTALKSRDLWNWHDEILLQDRARAKTWIQRTQDMFQDG